CLAILSASPRFKNNPNRTGAIAPATLVQIPMILIRLAAVSTGPILVIYGLDAVCKLATPPPIVNKSIIKIRDVLVYAAGITSDAPIAITPNEIAIPFLNPYLFKTHVDTGAMTK